MVRALEVMVISPFRFDKGYNHTHITGISISWHSEHVELFVKGGGGEVTCAPLSYYKTDSFGSNRLNAIHVQTLPLPYQGLG
jgi:hypothetical protein